jgi:hypothetical protein
MSKESEGGKDLNDVESHEMIWYPGLRKLNVFVCLFRFVSFAQLSKITEEPSSIGTEAAAESTKTAGGTPKKKVAKKKAPAAKGKTVQKKRAPTDGGDTAATKRKKAK